MVEAHLKGVRNAIERSWHVLSAGGSALDAVVEAVVILEDDESFDARRGAEPGSLRPCNFSRYGGRDCTGSRREHCRRYLDRRHAQQSAWSIGRFVADWVRLLCR